MQNTSLHQWQSAHGGTDSLNAGFSFPLRHGDTVTAAKPIRANRYVKRGSVLTFRGLGFMVVLFTNPSGQWVKLQHADLAALS